MSEGMPASVGVPCTLYLQPLTPHRDDHGEKSRHEEVTLRRILAAIVAELTDNRLSL